MVYTGAITTFHNRFNQLKTETFSRCSEHNLRSNSKDHETDISQDFLCRNLMEPIKPITTSSIDCISAEVLAYDTH